MTDCPHIHEQDTGPQTFRDIIREEFDQASDLSKKERQRMRTGHKGREGQNQGGNDFPKAPCLPKLDRIRPSFGQGAKGAKGRVFEKTFSPPTKSFDCP